MDKVAIIDGDGIPYVASNYCAYRNLPIEDAFNLVDNLVENIITATKCDDYLMFFTGFKNYRDNIVDDYKDNRIATKAKTQPNTFKDVKKYTIDRYQAYYVNGIEADDACGIMASRLDNYVVVSNDKDLLQIEGDHYNYRSKKHYHVTKEGDLRYNKKKDKKPYVTGEKLVWFQTLCGDPVDNIKGIPGIGPIKAYRILEGSTDIKQSVIDAYKEYYDKDYLQHLYINYNLVKILREADMKSPSIKNYHYVVTGNLSIF